MSVGGMEIVGIVLQVLILFSLVIITDRLLKIQRLGENNQEQREQADKTMSTLSEVMKRLVGRHDSLDTGVKGEAKKTANSKPRAHPDIRKTRKICPECEAFIPVDDPRCSNCGYFFDGRR